MGRIVIPVPLSQGLCDREHIAKASPGSEVVCQRTKSPPASTSDPSGSAHTEIDLKQMAKQNWALRVSLQAVDKPAAYGFC